jgi:hypothetical protein
MGMASAASVTLLPPRSSSRASLSGDAAIVRAAHRVASW